MTTRHITVSTQEGMVTELEMIGGGIGAGQKYMLRYHKMAPASANKFEINIPSSASWSGFRYRDNEVSVLLLRQGRSSAAA